MEINIKATREALGYSQKKCAEGSDMSEETFRKYEKRIGPKLDEKQRIDNFLYKECKEKGISPVFYEPMNNIDKTINILSEPNSRIIPKPLGEKGIRFLEKRYNALIPTVKTGSMFFYFEAESGSCSQIITKKVLEDNKLSIVDILSRVEKQMVKDVHLKAYFDYGLKNEITAERVLSENKLYTAYIVSNAEEYETTALLLHPGLGNTINHIYKGKGCYIQCMKDRLVLKKMSDGMSAVDQEKYLNDIGENDPNYISKAIPFLGIEDWGIFYDRFYGREVYRSDYNFNLCV